jgi:hypothetical protein
LKNRGEGGFLFELHGIAAKSRFPNAPYSELHNLLSWNAGGIRTQYTGNLHLKNVRIIGGFHRADDVGARLGAQGGNSDLIENLRVEGFPRGVTLPTHSTIKGGFFATGLGIPVGVGHDVTIDLTDMKFAPTEMPVNATVRSTAMRPTSRDAAPLSAGMKYDLHVQPIITTADFNASFAFAPRPPTKVNGHPKFPNGAQLYSLEQMPDYVLPDFGVPGILDGKTTTREAWEKYRLAPGGVMAPPGTAPLEGLRSNGVFGPPVEVDVSASPRGGRAPAQGRPAMQGGPAVRRQAGQPTNTSRPTREEMAAVRDARAAARAARRGNQDSADQPAAEPPASPREPRSADRRGQEPPDAPPPRDQAAARETRRDPDNSQVSALERGRQPRMRPGSTDGNAGPAWELVPKSGGGMSLVPTGNRPRIPGVSAGLDQTVSLSQGAALQGSAAAGTSVQWSKAYGPGSVTFDDGGRAQTRVRFSTRGTYVLHLTVADQAGQKNTASVTVIVL